MPRFDRANNQLVDKAHTCSALGCDTDTYQDVSRYLEGRRKAAQSLLAYAHAHKSKAVANDIQKGCASELSLIKELQGTADAWYAKRKKGKHA